MSTRPRGSAARILVIDDNLDLLEALKDILEAAGYAVETASTIGSGLLLHRQKPFHLLLVDYELPDATGLVLATHVSRGSSPAKIIMMSGRVNQDWVEQHGTNAIHKFLPKPVPVTELLQAIYEVLGA